MQELNDILFLDIETVPLTDDFTKLAPTMQSLWLKKYDILKKTEQESQQTDGENYFSRSGVFSEFARIVCISVGMLHQGKFILKSFASEDEREILTSFCASLEKLSHKRAIRPCGHNIKEFDIPFICRRLLINGIKIPDTINATGKKPWEVNFIDTLDMWRFGDYKSYTSLRLLCEVLQIPTPKDDIDGSEVAQVYYTLKDLNRISTYCKKDVVATARLYQRLCSKPLLKDEDILFL